MLWRSGSPASLHRTRRAALQPRLVTPQRSAAREERFRCGAPPPLRIDPERAALHTRAPTGTPGCSSTCRSCLGVPTWRRWS